MSALPPKADMCSAAKDVCFGPKADIQAFGSHQKKNPGTLPISDNQLIFVTGSTIVMIIPQFLHW
jgi:hypothetical protein